MGKSLTFLSKARRGKQFSDCIEYKHRQETHLGRTDACYKKSYIGRICADVRQILEV